MTHRTKPNHRDGERCNQTTLSSARYATVRPLFSSSAPLRAPTSSVAETATKPSHGRRGLPSASTSTHGSRRSTAISCWRARFDNNESPSFDLRGAAQQQPARRLIEAPRHVNAGSPRGCEPVPPCQLGTVATCGGCYSMSSFTRRVRRATRRRRHTIVESDAV